MAELARATIAKVSVVVGGSLYYPDAMSEQDVARFRAQADECRQLAERAVNPLDKEAWLRLAGEWIKLAQNAEGGPRKEKE
ncbi:hypothetical protein [Bradyrhizobium japonicum]|uniref:hypothetical protein n=1 Tax=Bradyrhizobium japonicum TaxID=375 RepID=UPI001B8A7BBF|nr:hypothetical protein [Bradyrhizobium japonicum]MBR0975666.1 hypothetical protein [Bradyrhizobium japonicum]